MALTFALVSGLLFASAVVSIIAVYRLCSQASNLLRHPELRTELSALRFAEFYWYTVASINFTALLYYVIVKKEWYLVLISGTLTYDPFLNTLYTNVIGSLVCAAVMTVFNFVTMVMGVWDTKSDAENPVEEKKKGEEAKI